MPATRLKKVLQQNTGKTLYQTPASTLRRAEMSNLDLTGADLAGEDLSGASLDGATLSGAALARANLAGARLRGATLKEANLSGADLSGADLYGASLRGASLEGADLAGARLDGANMREANLQDAILSGATFGNRLPSRADIRLAWLHIQRILCATPDFLLRRLLPITLPLIAVMAAYILLRITIIDLQYDRTRLPSGWARDLAPLVGLAVDVGGILAIGAFLRRIAARLGTRKATEGYWGLLFFFVSGVYLVMSLSGYMNDDARVALSGAGYQAMKVFGFAILVTVVMAVYGVPARLRPRDTVRVEPLALWRAVGILAAFSALGLALMNARMLLAPFLGHYPAPEAVDAFWRHVQIFGSQVAAILLLWGILPRLPFPATLERADLRGANLGGANLRGLSLRAASLQGACLGGAELRHADLRGADLTDAGIEGAVFDATTRWPEGFDAAAHGARRVPTSIWHLPITSLLLRRREF